MKYVIELDEKRFKDIQRIASVLRIRRSLTCEQIIANGRPLEEELEEIKADVINIADGRQSIKVKSVRNIIDRRIKELKNE